ncbi:hypothetical protein AB0J65_33710, partial [Streptomyces toxytricini]
MRRTGEAYGTCGQRVRAVRAAPPAPGAAVAVAAGRGHAGCVTARPDSGPGRDALARVLVRAAGEAVRAVDGFAGGVYLRSGAGGVLLVAALAGLPGPLFRPWWRIQVNRPFPVAEAHRTGAA